MLKKKKIGKRADTAYSIPQTLGVNHPYEKIRIKIRQNIYWLYLCLKVISYGLFP